MPMAVPERASSQAVNTLGGINVARALSCLIIAYFHIAEFLRANGHPTYFPFPHTPGIHVFMVISGFICVYTARANDTTLGFMGRRLARLIPLYWALTTIAVVCALTRPWLLPAADPTPLNILRSYLLIPYTDLRGLVQPILFVGWMVGYILLLNFVYAISLIARPGLRGLAVGAGILAVMGFAVMLPPGALRTFLTNPIQFEFAAGVLVGEMLRNGRVAAWLRAHPIWPMTALATVALIAASLTNADGALRAVLCGVPAVFVVFGLASQDMYRAPIRSDAFTWLGQISYSIYLLHPLVIPLVGIAVLGRVGVPWIEDVLMIVVTLGLTIFGAHYAYKIIERPANDWLRNQMALRLKAVTPV